MTPERLRADAREAVRREASRPYPVSLGPGYLFHAPATWPEEWIPLGYTDAGEFSDGITWTDPGPSPSLTEDPPGEAPQ
jgi:hypothetical protein